MQNYWNKEIRQFSCELWLGGVSIVKAARANFNLLMRGLNLDLAWYCKCNSSNNNCNWGLGTGMGLGHLFASIWILIEKSVECMQQQTVATTATRPGIWRQLLWRAAAACGCNWIYSSDIARYMLQYSIASSALPQVTVAFKVLICVCFHLWKCKFFYFVW